ncbi:phage tail protein [Ferrovibrio sp.]|uniref:phage tail protein n=1 Tax=Ferrovibrio sp. TaxID=1917215 RepID=UPI003D2D5C95
MSDWFLGEIRIFSFNRIPAGWHVCDGSAVPVQGNQALFTLLGNTFGGNNVNFNLPNLQGRAMVHMYGTGSGMQSDLGKTGGSIGVTLSQAQIQPHNHTLAAVSGNATTVNPTSNLLATCALGQANPQAPAAPPVYAPQAGNQPVALESTTIASVGGSQPHENRQPNMALVCCIALTGIYPPRP